MKYLIDSILNFIRGEKLTEIKRIEVPDYAHENIIRIIDIEGGYVNDSKDSGGATKYGVTEAVARAYGYNGDMKDLPYTTAYNIYAEQYYYAPNFNLISDVSRDIGFEVFDSGVNCGTSAASKWLQRCLNILNREGKDYPDLVVDGVIGNKTKSALGDYLRVRGDLGEKVLFNLLNCLQGNHYITLAERREKDQAFITGWATHRLQFMK